MSSSSRMENPPTPPAAGTQPYLDFGPPLPDRHGVPVLCALVRDPRKIFAYWELPGAASTDHVIELRNVATGETATTVVDAAVASLGSRYLEARPDTEYELVLGRRDGATFQPLLTSRRVRTPRDVPAGSSDESLTPGEQELWRTLGGAPETGGRFGYRMPR